MSVFGTTYDTIVIGGGLAGVHAAKKTATRGRVLLVTSSWDTIAALPRGPVFCGSQADLEVEAMAFAKTTLQQTSLCQGVVNGAPVRSVDADKYQEKWQVALERAKRLTTYQDTIERITSGPDGWQAASRWGALFTADRIVLAVGTFLGGVMCYGGREAQTGRPGEQGAVDLERSIADLGPVLVAQTRRVSPTIKGASLDWTQLRRLPGGGGRSSLHQTELADGRKIILAPINRTEQQLYPYLVGERLGAIDEESLRGARGFKDATMITRGYEATFRRLASGQVNDGGEYAGAPGLYFAGSVAGSVDYKDSIRTGILAGSITRVSRET